MNTPTSSPILEKGVDPRPGGEAAWQVRSRTRMVGRRHPRCAVGTTLLVKGLEFDHAVVLNPEDLDARNLYVAMTRGAKSLTVFSRRRMITPAGSA